MTISKKMVLSLDLGTTSLKVGLFSVEGDLLSVETREQELLLLGGGKVEQSPRETWRLIGDAVKQVIKDHNPHAVSAIALSLQRGTVIPLDKHGEPLSNLITWMDKRSLPIAQKILLDVSNERYYNISGHPISYISGTSKALWLIKEAQDIQDSLAIIGPPETLFLRWLGCDEFVCSQSTGTYLFPFEIEKKRWSVDLSSKLGFPLKKLPRLVTSVEIVGHLSEHAGEHLGLPSGIPLVPGGGDGQCAAVGCGVVKPSLCMINIGTAAGVQTFLPKPLKDPLCVLNCAANVIPDAWEMEGHTQCSGAVFRWLRDEFGAAEIATGQKSGLDAYDLLLEQAIQTPPGAEGLLFLPTFNGSTAPIIDQDARGVLLGLNLSHTRNHVIRSVLEGISLEIEWILDAITEIGADIDEIRLVGGGSRNRHWNQIHADILNRQIKTLEITDSALVGAAICAAVAIGEYKNIKEASTQFVKVKKAIDPDPQNIEIYRTASRNYRATFKLLSQGGIFKNLGS
jgi:xylulokinase